MPFESKKTLLIRLYQVLCEYSDAEHPLMQQELIRILSRDYGIDVERKAIGRNISYLAEMGYEIVSTRHGCYLSEKPFDQSELRLLIDSVLCNRHINATHSKDLINKIIALGGRNFRSHVKHVYSVNEWNKSNNQAFFYNIDIIDEAIETNKQILFDYNKIGIDKKMHKTKTHKVSPYQMILHNQHYFLMCYEEYWQNVAFYRLDKITNIQFTDTPLTPIRSLNGYENGINYKELATARPYMFADKPERIVLVCPEWFFDELVDWFGADVKIEKSNNDMITVTLTASPKAMEYWALQYGANTEIIEPQHLRDSIKEKITALAEKYN